MAKKRSIWARIFGIGKANANAALDALEDPQKMLDQQVRDYTNNIAQAESAVAQTIGNLRMAEDDQAKAMDEAKSWGSKALAASSLDSQFAALEDLGEETEVEARLAAMKGEQNVLDEAPTASAIEAEAPAVSEIEARLAAMKKNQA
ncbi:PspA/IM30 family protein [Glutamicibacter ardleyensis]|uniref:PspA/IM30 family protein n=1 Tax=Glutamicibacter ardleyensis TaxID=225894 RepID=UPI003FD5433D